MTNALCSNCSAGQHLDCKGGSCKCRYCGYSGITDVLRKSQGKRFP